MSGSGIFGIVFFALTRQNDEMRDPSAPDSGVIGSGVRGKTERARDPGVCGRWGNTDTGMEVRYAVRTIR